MVIEIFSDNKMRFGGIFIIFLLMLFSVNGAFLTEGIDVISNYKDSSKGMGWSTLNITANTGIAVNDEMTLPYIASNSTDTELIPLLLRFTTSSTNICANELIASQYSLPVCFRNGAYTGDDMLFIFRESLGLFESKEYDIRWGKKYQKKQILNFDSNNFTFQNVSVYNNNLELEKEEVSYASTDTTVLSFSDRNISNLYFNVRVSITGSSSHCLLTYFQKQNLDNSWTTVRSYQNYGVASYTYTHTEPLNETIRGARIYFNNNCGASGSYSTSQENITAYTIGNRLQGTATLNNILLWEDILKFDTDASITLNGESVVTKFIYDGVEYDVDGNLTYENTTSLQSGNNFGLKFYLNSSSNIITPQIDENVNMNLIKNEEMYIVKETDDAVNGFTLIPQQANGDWISYLTIKDLSTTTLYYDLYDMDTIIDTNDLDSHFSGGSNTIVFDQVNDDGLVYLSVIGQYNNKPIVQGTVSTNTTTFKKGTTASCSGGTYYDADSDPQSGLEWSWHKNGAFNYTGQTIDLNSSSFVKTDLIKCCKRYNDGIEWSDYYCSTEYTVQDTSPTYQINITPLSPQPTDDLVCNISNYYDIDGDTEISHILSWQNNGSILVSNSANSLTLPNAIISTNEIYKCNVEITQAGGSYNVSQLASLSNVAPTLDSITTPSNTYSNYVSIPNFCTATDINNDQLYWTFDYSTDLANWYNIATNQTSNTLSWDISLLNDGTYYMRCKVNDAILETNYSNTVSLNVVNFVVNHTISSKSFISTLLTLESSSASNMNQYTQGTTGIFCGDFNEYSAECYFYTPVQFDGAKSMYYVDITPYQYSEAGTIYATGFTKNVYDVMLYEVSSIGDIPSTNPLLRKTGVTFEMDAPNRINFNVVPGNNLYVAVKVCVNSQVDGSCGIVDNGDDDLIFLYGKTSGSYIMKTKQGFSTPITSYDPNIEFLWQDLVSDNLIVEVSDLFGDNQLVPLLVKDSLGSDVCVHSELSSFYTGVDSSCISQKNSTVFEVSLNDVSKATNNEYDILWGKILDVTGTTYNDALLRPVTPSSDVRMVIYGIQNGGGSYTSNVDLTVNGQDIFSYPATLSSKETVSSVRQYFNVLLNSMVWSTNTLGKIVYHFEPYYIDFDVSVPSEINPINNGISPLRINISTNLDISTTLSYCKIEGNNVLHQTNSFSQISVGNYSCEPSMEFSDLAGSYKWTVYIQDSNGQFRQTDGFFTYTGLDSYTVTNLNFGDIDFENNTEEVESNFLIENTGNKAFSTFDLDVIEDKFWHESEDYYYDYEGKLGYASTKAQLKSVKNYNELDIDDTNEIYNGTLNPTNNFELWWKGTFESTMKEGDWSTKWDLISEVIDE